MGCFNEFCHLSGRVIRSGEPAVAIFVKDNHPISQPIHGPYDEYGGLDTEEYEKFIKDNFGDEDNPYQNQWGGANVIFICDKAWQYFLKNRAKRLAINRYQGYIDIVKKFGVDSDLNVARQLVAYDFMGWFYDSWYPPEIDAMSITELDKFSNTPENFILIQLAHFMRYTLRLDRWEKLYNYGTQDDSNRAIDKFRMHMSMDEDRVWIITDQFGDVHGSYVSFTTAFLEYCKNCEHKIAEKYADKIEYWLDFDAFIYAVARCEDKDWHHLRSKLSDICREDGYFLTGSELK